MEHLKQKYVILLNLSQNPLFKQKNEKRLKISTRKIRKFLSLWNSTKKGIFQTFLLFSKKKAYISCFKAKISPKEKEKHDFG